MARYSKWLWVPKWGRMVFACAKGGSSSLYHEIAADYGVELEATGREGRLEDQTDIERLTVAEAKESGHSGTQYVQHPMTRFESLWKDKARDGGTTRQPIAGMSPATLLDFVIEHDCEDHHWTHQHLHRVLGTDLQHITRFGRREHTTTGQIPPYSRIRLMEHYREDYRLWRRAR